MLLSTPEDIYTDAYNYLFVLFLGIPFTLLYNLLSAVLRAVGDSKTPFFFLAFATILNIILDLLFIKVFQWGCVGAAVATITAQAVSGILCACVIYSRYRLLRPTREDCHLHPMEIRSMIVMGIPMGLQYSITAVGSMVMQSANNGLGSVYVSGFTVGIRIKQFFMCPFDAIATAVSVFCSQNLGAGKIQRIKKGLCQGILVGVAYGATAGMVLIFAGRAVFSGVMEMIARIAVSTLLVPIYGYSVICFTDPSAWLSACVYIVPTCLFCLFRISNQSKEEKIAECR